MANLSVLPFPQCVISSDITGHVFLFPHSKPARAYWHTETAEWWYPAPYFPKNTFSILFSLFSPNIFSRNRFLLSLSSFARLETNKFQFKNVYYINPESSYQFNSGILAMQIYANFVPRVLSAISQLIYILRFLVVWTVSLLRNKERGKPVNWSILTSRRGRIEELVVLEDLTWTHSSPQSFSQQNAR